MDVKEKEFLIEKSYLTKEELIEILQKIDFSNVNNASLDLITGFIINDEGDIKSLSKRIEIN